MIDAHVALIVGWIDNVHIESAEQRMGEDLERNRSKDLRAQAPPRATEAELMRNAHHESAHAVVAQRMGLRVSRVCCRPDGSGCASYEVEAESFQSVFRAAVASLAGIVHELSSGADRYRQHQLAHSADVLAARLSIHRCQTLAPHVGMTAELAANLGWCAVHSNWASIERVAACLRALGELDGPTIAALCGAPQ